MFGWPHEDVKQECEYLAKQGWMGVKVFPVSESVFSYEWPQNGELNPWWFYYQPVSYKLAGRGGTREDLREMIQTCRGFGVRVYADAVVNHMSNIGVQMSEVKVLGKTEVIKVMKTNSLSEMLPCNWKLTCCHF